MTPPDSRRACMYCCCARSFSLPSIPTLPDLLCLLIDRVRACRKGSASSHVVVVVVDGGDGDEDVDEARVFGT